MENETANKPHTKWWMGLILVLLIIIAGAPSILYSMRYVVIVKTGLLNWQFMETAKYMPEDLMTKLSSEDDKQAAINKWCDWLIEKDKDYEYRLDNWQEANINNFVVNSAAAKLIINSKKLPDDMIFIFDGTEGWNQVGSKDMIGKNYDGDIFTAVKGNFEIIKVPVSEIDRLRWEVSEKEKPFYNASNPYIKYTWLTAALIAAVIIAVKCRSRATAFAITFVAPFTGFTTMLFAVWGNQMLYHPQMLELPNMAIFIIGAAAGASFVAIASSLKDTNKTALFCKLILLGAIIGLITSTLTHTAIMAFRETTELSGIKGGAGYGIYAGLLIGIFTYLIKLNSNSDINHPGLPATPPFEGGEL